MEDGVFLGRVINEVARGIITLPEAVSIYEAKRIPRAWTKAQASFTSGSINMAIGDLSVKRNKASAIEVQASARNVIRPTEALPAAYRSWQMYCNPMSIPGILNYDAESDADNAVCEFLQGKTEMDDVTLVTKGLWDKWWGVIN
jgi:salicylate hydroxylase